MQPNDEWWMGEAILEARKCLDRADIKSHDVPIGAVCVAAGQIVGRGHNRRELDNDPCAHAEVLALRETCAAAASWRLPGTTLYVTLEPCPMCAGAVWLARIDRLVFGAWDPKAGACGSVFDIVRDPRLNHRPQVRGGVLAEECGLLLREFFAERRANRTDES